MGRAMIRVTLNPSQTLPRGWRFGLCVDDADPKNPTYTLIPGMASEYAMTTDLQAVLNDNAVVVSPRQVIALVREALRAQGWRLVNKRGWRGRPGWVAPTAS